MQIKRRFSSYGPVDTEINYYVSRKQLLERAILQLTGENQNKGGHFFTVWAPRQTGKSWLMWQTMYQLQAEGNYTVICMSVGILKDLTDNPEIFDGFKRLFETEQKKTYPDLKKWADLKIILTKQYFDKPFIWIIDEFDALPENTITILVNIFREIYLDRNKGQQEQIYNLHGLALIGVRSVLGIDNKKGSPFNIQKSIHIPNLTFEEVKQMFDDYQREWEQSIAPEVVERLFYETNGQPGLVSWFGELMVEKYNKDYPKPIGLFQWNGVYSAGSSVEPNNTVLNLISKASDPKYRNILTELFETTKKSEFSFDNPEMNYLYMNGVIIYEAVIDNSGKQKFYAKFSSPFVQKRLFNRFANELYPNMGKYIKPFENINHIYNGKILNIKNLLLRFEQYFNENKTWLLQIAPRRKTDLQICEATFHFILYSWLERFLYEKASLAPEFPTGNGKVDLLIKCEGQLYGIELKSFTDIYALQKGIHQAALYAKQLKLTEIYLAIFIETIDTENRTAIETEHIDAETQVKVYPQFIITNE